MKIFPLFVLTFISHATGQRTHVVFTERSGIPLHFPNFSEMDPVGQTSTHAPQNSQPASTWVSLKAVPTMVLMTTRFVSTTMTSNWGT